MSAAESAPAMSRPEGGQVGFPRVQGNCPACGHAALFLGAGGYVTCSVGPCPEPDAATTLLEAPSRRVRAAVDAARGGRS